MKVRDMSNEEARYAIYSAIEMGETINAGVYPYHSVLVCAERALEKQIAKDVIDITPSYSDTGVYRCPKCKEIYTFKQGKPNYCYECGQRINWNGVD